MSTIYQAQMATREFTQEFERHAKEETKVYFFLALKKNTLSCLDSYITMQVGERTAHLETI